jgi:nitronate monooxygenase
MLTTKLTRLLKIETPIIQAPIGSASCPALVAAVSNAGGLGMLSITWRSLDETRQAIWETKKLTNKPFGVNLVLEWNPEERLQIALENSVPVISFFWGDPSPYVEQIHRNGGIVLHTVGSSAEVNPLASAGVDVLVAQGVEAGGHVWGQVGTFTLLPSVVDAARDTPVVAAGGIADGRGVAAALTLGAAGVWLGTRFVASEEAYGHALYKQKILEATETDTAYSTLFDRGWENAPHRTLRNSTVEMWEEAGRPLSNRPGEGETIAHHPDGRDIERYEDMMPLPGMTGEVEKLALYAGQSSGLIRSIQSAGDIVRELTTDAKRLLKLES